MVYWRKIRYEDMNSTNVHGSGLEDAQYYLQTDQIHLYDVVDRMLVEMFRDSSRNRYMSLMNHAMRVVHMIAMSIRSLLIQWKRQYEMEGCEKLLVRSVTLDHVPESSPSFSFMFGRFIDQTANSNASRSIDPVHPHLVNPNEDQSRSSSSDRNSSELWSSSERERYRVRLRTESIFSQESRTSPVDKQLMELIREKQDTSYTEYKKRNTMSGVEERQNDE